jgi:hypothetical protein
MNKISSESIRRYFYKKPSPFLPIVLIILGLIILFGGYVLFQDDRHNGRGGRSTPLLLFGLILLLVGIIKLLTRKKSPLTDEDIDAHFQKDIKAIEKIAMKKLGLDKDLLIQNREEPLTLKGPILWSTTGIDDRDLMWKKGKDGIVRFSVNRVTVIYFSKHLLAAYACDYNFIKAVTLNETTSEYFYKDIVSVSTSETSTSYVLPNGVKLKQSQEFRLSITNGEAIKVFIDSGKLSQMTDGDIPTEEAERAVQMIRTILRDKRQ